MLVEDAAGVRESIQGVGDAIFLCGIEVACEGDVRLQHGDDPVAVWWEWGIQIRGLDVHGCHGVAVDVGELEDEGKREGHDCWAISWWWGDLSFIHGAGERVPSGGGSCLVLVWFSVCALLALAL